MSRVHARNTGPEMYVRRTIWAEGFRYRLHVKKLPGNPDLALTKYRFDEESDVAAAKIRFNHVLETSGLLVQGEGQNGNPPQ